MSDRKFPTLYLGKTIIKDNVLDFGDSSVTAKSPINDNDITNKIYVDTKISTEASARSSKDIQLENEVKELKAMLETLQTSTNTLLESNQKKINDLYLVLYRMSMDKAIGVDENYQMILQYSPSNII